MKNLAEHLPLIQRADFLRDNCESVEQINYAKRFSPEELVAIKDRLSDVDIEVSDHDEDRKSAVTCHRILVKPLKAEKVELLKNIRQKAIDVTEECFRFIDEQAKSATYYSANGEMVYSRPMKPEEYQRSIFPILKNTGVNSAE